MTLLSVPAGLSNSFHADGTAVASPADKEVVLIALRRPLVYVQPMAVDKAILVWLNYRNAYDYWSEQRRTLNREVLTATQQVRVGLRGRPEVAGWPAGIAS